MLMTFGMLLGMLAALPMAAQDSAAKPAGQLILFADTAVFAEPQHPENCTLKNRFKRGDIVGFRLYAVDGGTNKPEESAMVVVHITSGGKTIRAACAVSRHTAQEREWERSCRSVPACGPQNGLCRRMPRPAPFNIQLRPLISMAGRRNGRRRAANRPV